MEPPLYFSATGLLRSVRAADMVETDRLHIARVAAQGTARRCDLRVETASVRDGLSTVDGVNRRKFEAFEDGLSNAEMFSSSKIISDGPGQQSCSQALDHSTPKLGPNWVWHLPGSALISVSVSSTSESLSDALSLTHSLALSESLSLPPSLPRFLPLSLGHGCQHMCLSLNLSISVRTSIRENLSIWMRICPYGCLFPSRPFFP